MEVKIHPSVITVKGKAIILAKSLLVFSLFLGYGKTVEVLVN